MDGSMEGGSSLGFLAEDGVDGLDDGLADGCTLCVSAVAPPPGLVVLPLVLVAEGAVGVVGEGLG